MAVLSDVDIRYQLDQKRLIIDPWDDPVRLLQPSSVDLRLGREMLIASGDGTHRKHDLISHGPLSMYQGMFVLGSTLEWIEIPDDLIGILVGKSSRAREGICVEDSGYVDPYWKGRLTVELSNRSPSPVRLTYEMLIAQIRFETMTSRPQRLYGDASLGSHYQSSDGPVSSKSR